MKIRTDFVTNSSSSSFCLVIRISLKNGKILKFFGTGGTGEGDEEYHELVANCSPSEYGESASVDELIELLRVSVVQGLDSFFDVYEDPGEAAVFEEDSPFIQDIREIQSMDEIKAITVNGDLWGRNGQHQYGHYTYYMDEGKLVYDEGGKEIISEGTGGKIDIEVEDTDDECDNPGKADVKEFEGFDADVPLPKERKKPKKIASEFKIEDGILLEYIGKNPREEIVIPYGVTEIGESAFNGLVRFKMKSIIIPDSVRIIGKSAFYDCFNLVKVILPNQLKSIEYGAFKQCIELTEITLPDSVEKIAFNAFSGCDKLTIYASSGSKGESYAKMQHIPIKIITC